MAPILLLLPLLGGCLLQTVWEELGPLDQEVSRVRVRAGDGTVTVLQGPELRVTREARTSSPGFELAWALVDGVLELEERCPLRSLCTVDTRIELPPGVDLDVRMGSGEVTLEGLDGQVELSAEGLILEARGLRSPVLLVSAEDALVDLELLAAPLEVAVALDAGDAALRLPAGPYALDLHTGLGVLEVLNVLDEPGAAGLVLLHTGAGDLRLLGEGSLPE